MWAFFFLLLIAFASFGFLMRKQSHAGKKQKLPPGEMGLPWIGETMEFFNAQKRNKLFEDFVQPRILKHGKIFKTRLMGSPTVIVNGSEANKFFLSNEFKLVKSSWPSSSVQLMGKDSIMEKDGERHRFLRGVIVSSFANSGLETLVSKICSSVQIHISRNWHGRETVHLYRSAKVLTFNVVFECLMGMRVDSEMLNAFDRVLGGVFSPAVKVPGSRFWRAKKAREEIEKMLGNVVREKKKEIIEGRLKKEEEGMLLSKLVCGIIKGEITEQEAVDNVVLLVFAAHDTTSFAVAMTFKMLAHHPDCYTKLLQEHEDIRKKKRRGEKLTVEDVKQMKYSWQVARESMRLHPPIFGSFRKTIADIDYEGFTIPKGWKVLWTAYGTHYNEEYFKDATRFKPSRFEEDEATKIPPYAFVPFGGGPRLCAGYQLAKLNILIFLHYVVTQFDWSLLHPHEPITLDPLPFPSLGLPIKISPRISLTTPSQL
ncbi:taxadiene 5-alpha hydroxylase-like [Neltuma alba]|uniref:taxadiene 5-alpha hydroxylase-like n=1 Tax=Neltuma alba TaxID=207710 RepID=UPI0010A595A5|nr:taxadiene 5-alpha hydroxylase-like [Prosopis alba]